MIVVADASPLRYLILIEHTHVLPALYGQVLVPPAVIKELSQEQTPDIVQLWIAKRPDWVRVQDPTRGFVAVDQSLGAGELAAIARRGNFPRMLSSLMNAMAVARPNAGAFPSWERFACSRMPQSMVSLLFPLPSTA